MGIDIAGYQGDINEEWRSIMPSSTLQVKEANRRILRRIFFEQEIATKAELAQRSGLSVVTVNSLIQDMLIDREVEEYGLVPSEGGRPSMRYRYRYERRKAAIVYAYAYGGENAIRIRTYVIDLAGKKLWEQTRDAEEISLESFEAGLDAAFAKQEHIGCIYFGLPGELVDGVVTLNDFPALVGERFLPHYKERYSVEVYVENDINAMTYGNYRRRKSPGGVSLAGIYIPERFLPGAGFVLNEAIYYGVGHMSGEIGRLSVPHDWLALDYGNEEAVAENLAAVLKILCMTLAPERFVLYGSFLSDRILALVEQQLWEERNYLPGLSICCYRTIEPDYESGLSSLALDVIRE